MAKNLRDKGYPQSREIKQNKSDKKKTVMTSQVDKTTKNPIQKEVNTPKEANPVKENLVNKVITAYNNRAFGNPNAPLLQQVKADYVDDQTDERAYSNAIVARNQNGDRLGLIEKNITPTSTNYQMLVDNLPFGTNEYEKTINTPVGNITAGYDGDTTGYLNYDSSPNIYYLQALINALKNRGTL